MESWEKLLEKSRKKFRQTAWNSDKTPGEITGKNSRWQLRKNLRKELGQKSEEKSHKEYKKEPWLEIRKKSSRNES